MTSKAARLRKQKAAAEIKAISLAGGDTAPNRPSGRDRRGTNAPVDARREALEARLRVAGIPATPEAIKAAVAPAFGDQVGLCIHALATGDEARAMWETFCRIGAARRAWLQRNIGQTGDPQNSAIAMVPEPMQADPDLRVDLRSAEERDQAAKRAEAFWREKLDRIPIPQLRGALRSAADGFNGPWWRDGRPTEAGRWAVDGLRWVVNGAGPK